MSSWFKAAPTMDETVFNLKLTSKQLARLCDKGMKDAEAEKKKIKRALEKGNKEAAAIYAQNTIRKKNEANNMLRLSSRLDAVVSRIQGAVAMQKVAGQMGSVVKGLDKAMQSMNLVQITEIMDKFESQVEEWDVLDNTLQEGMATTSTVSVQPEAVEDLMKQMADDIGMETQQDMASLPSVTTAPQATELPDLDASAEADLNRRLAALREA